ncbi:HigA family addiction module antitoxin [Accumulibacter sp.]|jgi:addiction module antidote protein, HigA family|uniref:HigA family addiction module antitoxin n=1 Tax=Accumulibacter sp. TaxID=2053492 RepID=UPI002639388A|nr:HigA family addiction module antitoxin [Accumulibacter sp.]HRI91909.1 HigA family addiction module antitoxin [Accumulibacter sp.]
MIPTSDILHPGVRIKADVIPPGMSVTKAAALMGVGRPALSNLLNGNAALSAEMAARLEKAFQYPLKNLMEMQARYEAAQAKQKDAPADTKAYVPPFLAIKANDIERWVSHNIPARTRLAVFLRTLVHSTGRGLTKVDFPGNDDGERPGWDGFVEADEGAPWVPSGRSGWEFGTNEDPKTKAEGDFEKSVKAHHMNERAEMTLVFVTPRRWAGKAAWLADKKAKRLWKDVRVYDASDLEQWLEQSLPAQAWFANETHVPAQHVRSLDQCWADWACVSTPPLISSLFSSAIDAAKRLVYSRLSKPVEGPILIAADSTQEALAFLSGLLSERGGEELASYRDRVLVFDKPGVLPRLAAGAQTFIPVAFTREVERELSPYTKSMHSFVIYPRNASIIKFDIVLEPANYETFNKALQDMGKSPDDISRLANASGRSLTVLRRQLSTVPAVCTPEWAADHKTAASLVPFLLVGAWNSQNETDKLGLTLLAGDRSYDDLEKECQSLAQLNDAPIWSVGKFRGVISKVDLLYAIAGAVTPADLDRYFSMARMVLGEDDPALDLPEDQRLAASIHGKTREFSSVFRESISETLVLLAVHGGQLFKSRLGIDTEAEAARVVRELLPTPLTTRILEANDHDLPTYAEAAPNDFLSILERDLKSETPAVLGLLRPVNPAVFGSSPRRTGLLWALEGLSWSPAELPRAAYILARLAQVEINDNWVNKPANSLACIFLAWMPQTAANHDQRVTLIKKLAEKFPDIAWKLCVGQFGANHQIGHYSHKPRWRPDGYGFGEPFSTLEPIIAFVREMVEMALTWKEYSLEMLCDLVERLHDLSDADQNRVWKLIEDWAKAVASDVDKAKLREKIRTSTLSRRATIRAKKSGKTTSLATAGVAAYAALEPSDLLNKHAWLFRDGWVENSADEIAGIEEIDFDKRDERIKNFRTDALREILRHRGLAGILELSERGNASWVIGALMASSVLSEEKLQELLRVALAPVLEAKEPVHSYKNLIGGAVQAVPDDDKREVIINGVAANLSEEEKVQLFILSPFGKRTWKLVDALSEAAQANYWSAVTPDWLRDNDAENNEAVERLLKATRPRAAFSCVSNHPERLDAQVLFRVLSEMAQGGNDQPGQYTLQHYYVEKAFKHLSSSPVLALDEKAGLEFAYIDVLARPRDRRDSYGIPNLERYIEAHPEFFVQAITWIHKRKDGTTDPKELQVPPERIKTMVERGYTLLEAIERIPGHNEIGELKADHLAKWITSVRHSCAELGRADIADTYIGGLLSHAPVGQDGVWPCEPVRDVMEDIQSESLMSGAHRGVYNSRGVHPRGEGGNQERQLAEKYRNWGQALQVSHPFVASRLLMDLARTYDHEASCEDADAGIRRRLH